MTPRTLPEAIREATSPATGDPGITALRLANYICEAFMLKSVEDLNAAPVGALIVDADRDYFVKDIFGWYLLGEKYAPEDCAHLITRPALMMPWEWQGEDDQLRVVYVPTSATARETRSPGVADVERFTAVAGFVRAQMYREAQASYPAPESDTDKPA